MSSLREGDGGNLPVVVVTGRANVGKSSLVNRVVGRRLAVVEEEPGVTRDRKALKAEWSGVEFTIVDTGGWVQKGSALDTKVSRQSERALVDADLILMVTDVTVGVTDEDLAVAAIVKRASAPACLVVNKVDDATREGSAWEFVSLGLGDPWPVSATHGRRTGELLDEVVETLSKNRRSTTGARSKDVGDAAVVDDRLVPEESSSGDGAVRVAIVGRPNVGKSTLFNKLIGEDRSVVHDIAGTTRDTIDTVVMTAQGPVCFVDTAGMRRPSRTGRGTEHHAVLRALDALELADIAILVVDATVGVTHQDQRLAERIGVSGCPALVVLNKWDLVATADREVVLAGIGQRLAFLGLAPVLKVSARSGSGVHRILPALKVSTEAYHRRIATGALNRALIEMQDNHPAPGARIRYAVQGAIDPPTFTLFANGRLQQTYLRYIERKLRETFDLGPTPIKLRVRSGGGR